MNLLLLHANDFIKKNEVQLSDRRFDHLKKIIKPKIDQVLDVGLLNGKTGTGKVINIDSLSITLTVELTRHPPIATSLTLILALPRPLMLKRILQTITSMGIKQIHLINSQRVEKSYWNSSDLAESVIYNQLILGLEQARDTVLPEIFFHKNFKAFIEKNLPEIINGKQALLAHLGNYPPCPTNLQEPCVLTVGPEGGFIDHEVEQLVNAGFQTVQIGQRPLRVEAAVTALLGRLLPI